MSEAARRYEAFRDPDRLDEPDPATCDLDESDESDEYGNVISVHLIPWRQPRPPDAPPPRIASAEHMESARFAYVEQLWRALYAPTEICDIVAKRFGVEPRTVHGDIARVRELYALDEVDPKTIALRKAQMRAKMIDLERECRAAGDRKTAGYLLNMIAKLDGLFAPTKIEVTDATSAAPAPAIQIDQWVSHLSAKGLEALEVVLAELEQAGVKHALPSGDNGNGVDASVSVGAIGAIDAHAEER